MEKNITKRRHGSFTGFLITIFLGVSFYLILPLIPSLNLKFYDYLTIIDNINNDFTKQVLWFFINFTEPVFVAGAISSIFAIIGGAFAWQLARKGSKKSGFSICYGDSNMWPWVLAVQILSLLITMYGFQYMKLFNEGVNWIPTFIVIVSAPAAIMLTYGPSIPNLLTAAILPAAFSTPIAYWMSETLMPVLGVPNGVANLLSMGFVGFAIMGVCNVLPWMEKRLAKPIPSNNVVEDVYSSKWFVRRAFSHFTEPHFYGNEIASGFLLVGAIIDWAINKQHGLAGDAGKFLPIILLSQFVASAVGIFLYAHMFEEGGWYGTFIPVVSVAPFCILFFGPTLPVAIFSAILGGIIGAPIASSLLEKLPKGIHLFVASVFSMAISTSFVWATMAVLPWF